MPAHFRFVLACLLVGTPAMHVIQTQAALAVGQTPSADTPSPVVTLTEARDLLRQGYYDRATEAFQSLSSDPTQAVEAVVGLAYCHMHTGHYEEAIAGLSAREVADSAEWQFAMAQLLARTGKYDAVLDHAASAIRIDADHTGARLLLGETLEMLGRRDDAIETYRWFDRRIVGQIELPRRADWITNTAVGFLRYSIMTRTNVTDRTKHALENMLQIAYERVDRSWWPARIAAADLLRLRYNNDELDGSVSDYKAALRINTHLPEAYVGLGEVALERWDFDEVERNADLALQVNPNFAPALHLLARNLTLQRRYDDAIETCDRALAVNPNDLVALSLSAAAAACYYDEPAVERMAKRLAAINPKCALFHRTLGDALGGIRQYAAGEREYLRAIEYDATDANSRTELGMLYMQWGREEKARSALIGAWDLDRYNQRTKFTLDLLDSLDAFTEHETEHFIVKFDKERDPGLGPYVADYLESIYARVTQDYDTEPTEKTIIEMFPTQRAFAVRITGKPWVHTVGACTGRVIALASPRRAPELMGPYNFAEVLTHEFTHTITLAATNNRIPHWFTEGLAVFSEDSPREFAWCQLLAQAARRDELFTLESIDWGFMRPRRPGDRQMAYAQSEWMCEYIVERFGYDSLNEMLTRFNQRQNQAQVFDELFGITLEAFDSAFTEWAFVHVERWGFDLTPPENALILRGQALIESADASVFGRLARAELDDRNPERALQAARRAVELDENERTGLEVLVAVLADYADGATSPKTQAEYDAEAWPIAERLARIDPTSWTAHKQMGEIALRRNQNDEAVQAFKKLQRLCPTDPASWRALAGIYLDRGDDDLALTQLLELARSEQHDADVPARIAKIRKRNGALRETQYWYRQALYIDPFRSEFHQALGETNMQMGDTKGALREYLMLTELEPTESRHFANAAFAAHKLGMTPRAGVLAAQAVKLDPNSTAKSLVPKP